MSFCLGFLGRRDNFKTLVQSSSVQQAPYPAYGFLPYFPFLWTPLASDLCMYFICPSVLCTTPLFSVLTFISPLHLSSPFRLLWVELSPNASALEATSLSDLSWPYLKPAERAGLWPQPVFYQSPCPVLCWIPPAEAMLPMAKS